MYDFIEESSNFYSFPSCFVLYRIFHFSFFYKGPVNFLDWGEEFEQVRSIQIHLSRNSPNRFKLSDRPVWKTNGRLHVWNSAVRFIDPTIAAGEWSTNLIKLETLSWEKLMTCTIIVWKLGPIIKQLDQIGLRFLYHDIQIML